MATAGSPAVLNALSAIVKDQLTYFTVVVYHDEPYYLSLGRSAFYFIKEDLSAVSLSVRYQSLGKCLTDERKPSLLQLQLTDSREPGYP
jgi:hypothetical protein